MVTRTAKGAKLEEMSAVVLTPAEMNEQQSSLEYLMAEKARVDAALKAAKAAAKAAKDARPQVSKLERVIAKQATQEVWLPVNLAKRVLARVKAGQDQATALNEVFAALDAAVLVELEKRAAESAAAE